MKEIIKSTYRSVLAGLAILGIGSIILSYTFKISLVIFSIISLVGAVVVYSAARETMKEEDIKNSFICLVASMLSGVFGIVHHSIYVSVYKSIVKLSEGDSIGFGGMYENMGDAAFFLSGILNMCVIFAICIYAKDETRREGLMALKDMSFGNMKGSSEEEASTEEPDIVLCKNADTGKNVIWPHGDRYVHALILGPTCDTLLYEKYSLV